jgi:hypothetical protein
VSTPESAKDVSVSELATRYREAAYRSGDISNPKQQRKWADEVHALYKRLAPTAAGREAIIRLMEDTDPQVAGWAAAHSLQWVPDSARKVLETIRDSDAPESLAPIAAKWTLREFDKGNLSFDY